MLRHLLLLATLLATIIAPSVIAQELEPRSFTNVPIDQSFLAVVVGRSEGDLSPTPTSPLKDAELRIDVLGVGLSRTFAFAGDSAKADMVVGRTCYEGSAIFRGEYVEGRRCEYLDPSFKFTWNFYGAPATPLAEIGGLDHGLVIGASVAVTAPWGTYDSSNLINAGANRWRVKPKFGMSKRVGRWFWELTAGASLFEDNDDFFNGIYVEQEPLYSTSAHLIYNFSRGWLSVDATYFRGGETTKDGLRQDDKQDNSRVGVTWSRPVNAHNVVKFFAHTGVMTRIGNDFDSFGIAWLYRF
jgi:hypothetical protein